MTSKDRAVSDLNYNEHGANIKVSCPPGYSLLTER